MLDLFGVYSADGQPSITHELMWSRLAKTVGHDAICCLHNEPAEQTRSPLSRKLWTRFNGRRAPKTFSASGITNKHALSRVRLMTAKRSNNETTGTTNKFEEAASKASSIDGRFIVVTAGDIVPRADEIAKDLVEASYSSRFNLSSFLTGATTGYGRAFVCAIYDRISATLTCARGLDGPPLYYYASEGNFWFGTRLPVIRRLSNFPSSVDYEAIAYYLGFGFPPPERALFRSLGRLKPGCILQLTQKGIECSTRNEQILSESQVELVGSQDEVLRQTVLSGIEFISNKRVAILGSALDPRTDWLTQVATDAGAAKIEPSPREINSLAFADALQHVRRFILSEGEVFASPALVILAARAHEIAGKAEIGLCADGSTNLIPGSYRHRLLAQKVLQSENVKCGVAREQPKTNRTKIFRDSYFEQLALFDDLARLEITGPSLAQWNLFHMADELGPLLETATSETAVGLARIIDGTLLTAGAIAPFTSAVGREVGLPINAPFAAPSIVKRLLPMQDSGGTKLDSLSGRALGIWPDEEPAVSYHVNGLIDLDEEIVREMLTSTVFLNRGLCGRLAINEMLEKHFNGTVPAGGRIWSLCCLELWFQEYVDYRR